MTPYESGWLSPPGPAATVLLRSPENGRELTDVPMLIDSGADVTLVPGHVTGPLQLQSLAEASYPLVGYDGTTSTAQAVQLELVFCRRLFRGQFLLIDQDRGILGRNVLNALRLLFDGPGLQWGVSDL